jgi:hypothetical protein
MSELVRGVNSGPLIGTTAMTPCMRLLYPEEDYRGSIVTELTNHVTVSANGNDVIVKALLMSSTG